MLRGALFIGCSLALASAGCGGNDPGTRIDSGHVVPGIDSGHPGVDAFMVVPHDAGSCTANTDCPGTYCNMGTHACCSPATPPIELCGDHVDQDCNGHDQSCGDNDADTFEACRPPSPDFTMCDCDDTQRDTFPGANEACDGRDNDCDGRIDEVGACCPACQALGDTTRGDVCAVDGTCQCSAAPGMAACPAGQACCGSGCIDTSTDINNCGTCGLQCTNQTDRCVMGRCYCGPPPGMSCTATTQCHSGTCG